MSNKSIIIPVNNKPTKIENGLTTKLIDDYDSVLSACRVDTQRTYGFDDSRRFTLFVYRQYLVSIFLVLTVHFFQLIGQLFNDIPVVGGIYAETPLELVFVVVDEQTIQ